MISEKDKKHLVEIYNQNIFILVGANGSLGLSILKILKDYGIRPTKVILITNSSNVCTNFLDSKTTYVHLKRGEEGFSNALDESISGEEVNLFYAAGYGQPAKFSANPAEVISANTEHLLQYQKYKLNNFAYISTSEIYAGLDGVANENTATVSNPLSPRAVYIESKRLGEAIVNNVLSKNAKRHASYRVALAFPPVLLSDDQRVLADLINGGLKNGIVRLNGGAQFMRQYQYGPNAAIKILASLIFGHSVLYNNSGSHVLTLEQLARSVGSILDLPVDISDEIFDASAPKTVLVDSNLINVESRYMTNMERSLEEYLGDMIDASKSA